MALIILGITFFGFLILGVPVAFAIGLSSLSLRNVAIEVPKPGCALSPNKRVLVPARHGEELAEPLPQRKAGCMVGEPLGKMRRRGVAHGIRVQP